MLRGPVRLVVVLCVLACAAGGVARTSQPNIVLIIGDDVGWANTELHCNISDPAQVCSDVKTPFLLQLKDEGVHLLRHYAYKFCSPTRSALMSGRLPIHVNEVNPTYIKGGGVSLNFTMLPEKLSRVGYATHHVGKWHLGMSSHSRVPTGRGFDSSLGYLLGAEDHWKQTVTQGNATGVDLWLNEGPAYLRNNEYGDLLFGRRAVEVIHDHAKNHRDSPLFLYVGLQVNHSPAEVPKEYQDRYPGIQVDRAIVNGMSSVMDDAIGKITTALWETTMWEDTLVVYISDNGGASGINANNGNNYPLRGGKHTDFEGGVRTAALVSGGFLPDDQRGSTRDGYMHACDWYTTLAKLAGASPADDVEGLPGVDGMDMWPMIANNEKSPRHEVPLASSLSGENVGDGGLIVGDYKIVVGGQRGIGFWTGPLYPNGTANQPGSAYGCPYGCLFNIKEDPTEHHDIKFDNLDLFWKLKDRLSKLASTAYQTGEDSEGDCEDPAHVMETRYHGFWGPFCHLPPFE
ncbi:hypothetical protein PTSG_09899 [Salpingoeca rosetta]|uniref:Sulfatase N-terminal domain-containing protein n=1 Tax=Salpingoeca rosetta (strain ATCC 50818 / BSB-021) TaxID=946362 RepID=F2UNG3_SALR5|nr:uncharacterized protein PTSG_09899 [Salpingoeca rosetta]EGD79168.1 hypothetical protein PTSG_09899 [Salpingoeca rosetta]|eukprot:XP_004989253.1 hypothetical protein PTSG_09899 [Salpingoeca rosetta]